MLGYPDPRLNHIGKQDFRITRMLSSFTKKDPPPHRVKPVPTAVLRNVSATATASLCPIQQATADMIILAFFFLLRPGEYTAKSTNPDARPFLLENVQLFVGPTHRLNLMTATPEQLHQATFATLTFANQKNGVKDEVVGHARSGDLHLCPVLALIRRVIHLRHHQAPRTTPLATGYQHGLPVPILPADITQALRLAVTVLGPSLGFLPSDVSARCLRAAGATALLCADVDSCHIQLLGRWRSDEMLRYLHLQAQPLMKDFSRKMLHGGAFTLIPNQLVPSY
mmetsp:Transcript_14147/g.26547  ORF Transcript_14147/g.26547 Transcript_14147/m.26547 type:complete len:282 (+) Transcript_14147:4312-5157(+)